MTDSRRLALTLTLAALLCLGLLASWPDAGRGSGAEIVRETKR